MIARVLAVGCVLSMLGPASAFGQDSKALIGVWERVADVSADGQETTPTGAFAVLVFSEDGHWAGVGAANADTQKRLDVRAQRGTYKVDGTTLIRPILSASIDSVGGKQPAADLIREFRVEGDVLILSAPGSKAYPRWRRVIR